MKNFSDYQVLIIDLLYFIYTISDTKYEYLNNIYQKLEDDINLIVINILEIKYDLHMNLIKDDEFIKSLIKIVNDKKKENLIIL